jgi:hypothetical protein
VTSPNEHQTALAGVIAWAISRFSTLAAARNPGNRALGGESSKIAGSPGEFFED